MEGRILGGRRAGNCCWKESLFAGGIAEINPDARVLGGSGAADIYDASSETWRCARKDNSSSGGLAGSGKPSDTGCSIRTVANELSCSSSGSQGGVRVGLVRVNREDAHTQECLLSAGKTA
jgi:hypothetical protein